MHGLHNKWMKKINEDAPNTTCILTIQIHTDWSCYISINTNILFSSIPYLGMVFYQAIM